MNETLFYVVFHVLVIFMLALDLFAFGRSGQVTMRKALIWSGIWIALSFVFAGVIYKLYDVGFFVLKEAAGVNPASEATLEFITAYLLEKSLSVDNLFVFVLIFTSLKLSQMEQHKALMYGVLGAIVMRVLFIIAGVELIQHFHWLIYVFGGFLAFTGVKLLLKKEDEEGKGIESNWAYRFMRRFMPISTDAPKGKFFIRRDGIRYATPLFMAVVLVESTDLIFAVDSIPAVLAITREFPIVYTSNIMAIMGLRSLYFALSGLLPMFRFLHYGLAAVLIFIGVKMMIMDWYKLPIWLSLSVVVGTLGLSVLLSIYIKPKAATVSPNQ